MIFVFSKLLRALFEVFVIQTNHSEYKNESEPDNSNQTRRQLSRLTLFERKNCTNILFYYEHTSSF